MSRYTVFRVLTVVLALLLLAAAWIPRLIWEHHNASISTHADWLSHSGSSAYLQKMGVDLTAVPVVHGQTVQVVLEFDLYTAFGMRSRLGHMIPAGTTIETNFVSWSLQETNSRTICVKPLDWEPETEGWDLPNTSTKAFAKLYISYLEQTDQTAAFETETGRPLTLRNAVWALRAIDREINNSSLALSHETPIAIDTLKGFGVLSLLAALAIIIVGFLLINAKQQAHGSRPLQAVGSTPPKIRRQYLLYRILLYLALLIWALVFFLLTFVLKTIPLIAFVIALLIAVIALVFLSSWLTTRRDTLLRRSEAAAQQQAESARFAAMADRLTQSEAPAKEAEPLPHESLLLWARTAAEYVPRPRRSAVYLELMDHLLQCAESTGSDEAAIAAMGDAHLVGRRLRREALAPTRLPALLAATLRGRSWVTLYSGEDAEQFARLHHTFSAAGLEFQSDELDAVTRGLTAVYGTLPPGMWGADTSVRRAGAPVSSVAGRIMTHATDYAKPTRYTLRIRRRDEPLARRLAR